MMALTSRRPMPARPIPATLCEDCGRPIAPIRLALRPDARYCVNCQLRHDRYLTADDVGEAIAAAEIKQGHTFYD